MPFWFRKITDQHILAQVNIQRPDDKYSKLQIYISEPILDRYKYLTVAYVTRNGTNWR